MKIYTKTGDKGTTSLIGGQRVSKAHQRLKTYGTLDELNSMIGQVTSHLDASLHQELMTPLIQSQHNIFNLGSQLACEKEESRAHLPQITEADTSALETSIDSFSQPLPELKNFILPGGHSAAACLHSARTICRRAERNLIEWIENLPDEERQASEKENQIYIGYLNRLSDALFTWARWCNFKAGISDTEWRPRQNN